MNPQVAIVPVVQIADPVSVLVFLIILGVRWVASAVIVPTRNLQEICPCFISDCHRFRLLDQEFSLASSFRKTFVLQVDIIFKSIHQALTKPSRVQWCPCKFGCAWYEHQHLLVRHVQHEYKHQRSHNTQHCAVAQSLQTGKLLLSIWKGVLFVAYSRFLSLWWIRGLDRQLKFGCTRHVWLSRTKS